MFFVALFWVVIRDQQQLLAITAPLNQESTHNYSTVGELNKMVIDYLHYGVPSYYRHKNGGF
jgi:hypothetical protein